MNFQLMQNSAKIAKFRGKRKIPRLSSKFCSLRKTVGPTDDRLPTYHINHEMEKWIATSEAELLALQQFRLKMCWNLGHIYQNLLSKFQH